MGMIAFPKPDNNIMFRRSNIIEGLLAVLPAECVITSEDERRPYETDAFTAYRNMPLAVVLPRNTQEVSAVLRYCHTQGVPVVPRGAGTSLAGGAIPQEDAIVIGVSKMSKILEIDYANRYARVQSGVTNLAVTGAVSAEGFFYAPDPSSQMACTIGGNVGMNSCSSPGGTISARALGSVPQLSLNVFDFRTNTSGTPDASRTTKRSSST